MSLLNNAYDAVENSPQKEVRISTSEGPNWAEIRVKDSGPGVPAALREKIFNPFYSTKPVGHGTGLGLSTSLGIIHDHGGELLLEKSEKGASFVIRLPRVGRSSP